MSVQHHGDGVHVVGSRVTRLLETLASSIFSLEVSIARRDGAGEINRGDDESDFTGHDKSLLLSNSQHERWMQASTLLFKVVCSISLSLPPSLSHPVCDEELDW